MSYSTAIEEQLELLDFLGKPECGQYILNQIIAANVARDPELVQTRTQMLALAERVMPNVRDILKYAGDTLRMADPFFVSKEIGSMLGEIVQTMPDWTMTYESLPSACGFVVFEKPVKIPNNLEDPTIIESNMTAFSWVVGVLNNKDIRSTWMERYGHNPGVPGVKADEVPVLLFMPYTEGAVRHGKGVPMNLLPWSFNTSVTDALSYEYGETYDDATADMPTKDTIRYRRMEAEMKVFGALVAFISQKLLVFTKERPDRAARRRLEKTKGAPVEPLVRVIALRRKQYIKSGNPAGDGEHDPVEWACQWMVGGHWRKQWYPSLQRHQAIWIAPYIKGPENKPLKAPRARVFAVVR